MTRHFLWAACAALMLCVLQPAIALGVQAWKLVDVEEIATPDRDSQHHHYSISFLLAHSGVEGEHVSPGFNSHDVGQVAWNAPPMVVVPGRAVAIRVQLSLQDLIGEWSGSMNSQFSVRGFLYDLSGNFKSEIDFEPASYHVSMGGDIHAASDVWYSEWTPPPGAQDRELRVVYRGTMPGGAGEVVFKYRFQNVSENEIPEDTSLPGDTSQPGDGGVGMPGPTDQGNQGRTDQGVTNGSQNLALGRPANQSSTYGGTGVDQGAHNAVDGVINPASITPQGLTHTNRDAPSWWQVDLGESKALSMVRVYNRVDCCGQLAGAFQILLSDDGSSWHVGYEYRGGDFDVIDLPVQGRARFVRIQLFEPNYLHLREVEVYGP